MDFIYLHSQNNKSNNGFRSPHYDVPTHRVIRIVEGKGKYEFCDSKIKVKAGDILLTSPGVRAIDFPRETKVNWQIINFSAPDYWMDKSHVRFQTKGRLHTLLNELISDLIFGKKHRKDTMLKLVIDIFAECEQVDSGANRVIHDMANYILENPHENYVVTEIAAKCGCSVSYFRTLFYKEMKMSPKAFIKKCKMDYAVRLMRNENLLVTEVAGILGYNDVHEFSKQFKTVFGKAPSKLVKREKWKEI